MRKMITAAALGLAVLTLAACAETHGVGNSKTSTTEETAVEKETKQKQSEGFHNMDALAESVKSTTNEKDKGTTVSEVTCISTGMQTATCHLTGEDNESHETVENSVEVSIAEDGTTWISH
jgi:ABC-type phosphate transport system substrate-binding protein